MRTASRPLLKNLASPNDSLCKPIMVDRPPRCTDVNLDGDKMPPDFWPENKKITFYQPHFLLGTKTVFRRTSYLKIVTLNNQSPVKSVSFGTVYQLWQFICPGARYSKGNDSVGRTGAEDSPPLLTTSMNRTAAVSEEIQTMLIKE